MSTCPKGAWNVILFWENNNYESEDFVFVNPVEDFIIISSKNKIDKLQIFNMLGNLIMETIF